VERDAFVEFEKHCSLMLSDVWYVQSLGLPETRHELINGDARRFSSYAPPNSIDLILTSPPYLNNYDYADRTRLESYFWGIYRSWGDITRQVRDRLIMAATTQVRQTALSGIRQCPGIAIVDKELHQELLSVVGRLGEARKLRAGKKTYDSVVAGYFEDMLQVVREAYTVLKPGGAFVFVLGDSAPYGIHIPTDHFIGRLALAVGFADYRIEVLRSRGDKWAHNTQRHHVPLRESILTITKKERM
jgi:DNA modification methylase